jgi:hypothetical protein
MPALRSSGEGEACSAGEPAPKRWKIAASEVYPPRLPAYLERTESRPNFWQTERAHTAKQLSIQRHAREGARTGATTPDDEEITTVDSGNVGITFAERGALVTNYWGAAAGGKGDAARRPARDEVKKHPTSGAEDDKAAPVPSLQDDKNMFRYSGHADLLNLLTQLGEAPPPADRAGVEPEVSFASAEAMAKAHVTYVSRSFIESWLRSPYPGEKECCNGIRCTGRELDIVNPFTLASGGWPSTLPRQESSGRCGTLSDCWLCRLCMPTRASMVLLFSGLCLSPDVLSVEFGVYTDTPGEFYTSDCQGPMTTHLGLVAPCPAVHLNQVEEVEAIGMGDTVVRQLRLTLEVPTTASLRLHAELLEQNQQSFFGEASCTLEGCIAGLRSVGIRGPCRSARL